MFRTITSSNLVLREFVKRFYSDLTQETFACGANSVYLTHLYETWKNDPKSVPESWDEYFSSLELMSGPSAMRQQIFRPTPGLFAPAAAPPESKEALEYYSVMDLIRKYWERGHFLADLDPLKLPENIKVRTYSSNRIPNTSIFNKEMLSKTYMLPENVYIAKEKALPLSEIIKRLNDAYCKYIGVECSHLHSQEKMNFIREKFETPNIINFNRDDKLRILNYLMRANEFEAFLSKKWPPEKRFGLEGGEVLIPMLNNIIEKSVDLGCDTFVIAIAHRGRLNVLANILHTPMWRILQQFMEKPLKEKVVGDVKYHLGDYNELKTSSGKPYKVSMICNPSHLEIISPVALGKTKADQFFKGDKKGSSVMAIVIHGDAALAGEGVVYETFNLGRLKFFETFGTIHIAINNQVGFSTNPNRSRSSLYCSDVAKTTNSPIIHVNGDRPEECAYVGRTAAEFRQKFGSDFMIDLVCYRKNGHNESDEPKFTQPLMYDVIRAHTPCFHQYSKQLVEEKVTTQDDVKKMVDDFHKNCDEGYAKAEKSEYISLAEWTFNPWDLSKLPHCKTGVDEAVIKQICTAMYQLPAGFEVHKNIARILKTREELTGKRLIDWGLAEAVAFGSLLKEGTHVRLTGEDAERGTFSHRHHVLHHQTKAKTAYLPLHAVFPGQAEYTVSNSALCELAVLGYEVGYSLSNPNCLAIWEGQFGDFVNMAQALIDTFVCSSEQKWLCQNGVVMLLPHGLEGAGPEHSSARIERYLQMSDDDEDVKQPSDPIKQLEEINWICANCTTPSNLVHIFRRQVCMPFRKPLILFTPKSMLRNPLARSSWDEILPGTEFKSLIPDSGPASKSPDKVKKLIFCSGKVYFDIAAVLKEKKLEDQIAVARIEQVCPFPTDLVRKEFDKYPNAKVVFCQEEHKNQGPYPYVKPRLLTAIDYKKPLEYIGRVPNASPATGNKVQFKQQMKKLKEDIAHI